MAEPHYGLANIGVPIGFDYCAGNIDCMDVESHGERIRRLRKAKGWTQKDLQAAAGVDQSTLSGIEKHDAMPSAETLIRLASALEAPAEYIMRGTSKSWPFDAVDLARVLALSPQERGYVEGRLDEAVATCERRSEGVLKAESIGALKSAASKAKRSANS